MYERAKCSLKADVTIAVGFSSEVGYNFSKTFMKGLAERLTRPSSSSQIGVVQFGRTADLKIRFNSAGDFGSAVNGLKFPGKAGSINKAMRLAYEQSFNVKNGMRNEAEQILVLVTDVNSADSAALKATLSIYREAGIKVIVVSTDKLVIPSDVIGSGIEMVIVKNFDRITSDEVLDMATNSICHSAGKEKPSLLFCKI